MPPLLASVICAAGILGLFYLDRYNGARLSRAIWIPAVWLFLISSRPVTLWLRISPSFSAVDATEAYVEGSPIDRAVSTFLMAAACAVLVARRHKAGVILRNNSLILLYLSFCLISILWSDFPYVAFKRWTKALADLGMVMIIMTEADPLGSLKRLLTRLGFLLFPLSMLFIKYYPQLGRRLTNSWTHEPVGVSTQKNELGLICMMYGVFFAWMLVSVLRERVRFGKGRMVAYGAIIFMIGSLLQQCNSTTSIAGFVSAVGVMLLAWFRRRQFVVVHVSVVGVIVLALAAMFADSSGTMLKALGKDPTLTGRKDIWDMVLRLQANPWIGTGFESFWLGPRLTSLRSDLPNFPLNEAHNGFLEIYLNLGWAGICFVSLLLATGYNQIMRGLRRDAEKASVFLGFFLCTIFYSGSEAGFRTTTVSYFFLLIVIVGSWHTVRLCRAVDGRWREPERCGNTRSVLTDEHATLPA